MSTPVKGQRRVSVWFLHFVNYLDCWNIKQGKFALNLKKVHVPHSCSRLLNKGKAVQKKYEEIQNELVNCKVEMRLLKEKCIPINIKIWLYSLTSLTCDCRGPSAGDRKLTEVVIIELFLLKIWKKKFENRTNIKGVMVWGNVIRYYSKTGSLIFDHSFDETWRWDHTD